MEGDDNEVLQCGLQDKTERLDSSSFMGKMTWNDSAGKQAIPQCVLEVERVQFTRLKGTGSSL